MALDWPVAICRLVGAKLPGGAGLIAEQEDGVLEPVLIKKAKHKPAAEKGNRAEGIAAYPMEGKNAVLIVYDAPGPSPLLKDENTVIGDVLKLKSAAL